MLEDSKVAARILAQYLQRAKSFYAEKLGLESSQMAWEVEVIEATMERLRARGVVFEEYDLPEDGQGHRRGRRELPEQGRGGEKAAWFRDSEGDLLGIGQPKS